MKKIATIFLLSALFTLEAAAQKPKLYIKIYGGVHGKTYTYRGEEITRDNLGGWQGGFGFRVSWRKIMAEADIDFIRSELLIELADSLPTTESVPFGIKLNSLNIPLKLGYIPVKTPFFKWFVYTGLGPRVNTRVILNIEGEEFKFRPNELDLRTWIMDWLLGTQFDIGWLNLDLYYGLGITNSTRSNIRTNSHTLLLNVGFRL